MGMAGGDMRVHREQVAKKQRAKIMNTSIQAEKTFKPSVYPLPQSTRCSGNLHHQGGRQ